MSRLRFDQPVIVSPPPGGGAPYAARYGQPGERGLIYVRCPGRGLHQVDPSTITPQTLGLADAAAARHAGGRT